MIKNMIPIINNNNTMWDYITFIFLQVRWKTFKAQVQQHKTLAIFGALMFFISDYLTFKLSCSPSATCDKLALLRERK